MVVKSGNALRRNWWCTGRPMEDLPHGHNVALNRYAQPVAYVRQRAGRWPLLTPRGGTTPAPRSDGGPPCGRAWEEQRHHRSLVPRDAMLTWRPSFRLLAMASPYLMISVSY